MEFIQEVAGTASRSLLSGDGNPYAHNKPEETSCEELRMRGAQSEEALVTTMVSPPLRFPCSSCRRAHALRLPERLLVQPRLRPGRCRGELETLPA